MAQGFITLVLMMINSCSYSTNDLMIFSFRYLIKILVSALSIDVNFANRFVWIRKGANPHGPKRVWVPKATPIFDVGVGSHMT